MAKVRERVLKEPAYTCFDCSSTTYGEISKNHYLTVEGLYINDPTDPIEVKPYINTELNCENCGEVTDDDFEEFSKGDTVYECAECEMLYATKSDAQECC